MVKAAINGFGRIGRVAFRIALLHFSGQVEIVAINTSGSMDAEGWAHMLCYDSAYGKFSKEVEIDNTPGEDPEIGTLVIEGKRYPLLAQKDPAKIPWRRYGVDVVIESTGVFRNEEGARGHLHGGAKRVIISSPEKGGKVATHIIGVNEYKSKDKVISNASCTTNCVAPIAAIMNEKIGVKKAILSTVHAVTSTQELTDGSGEDLRRARAAISNIVPTTTGAAIATTKAIKELEGLFDGMAIRVPVLVGSISDFTFLAKKKTSVEEVNDAFKEVSQEPRWRNVVAVTEKPLVSSDIVGRPESAIVDLSFTRVVDKDLVKVMAWYDNEWGYATRLIEQTINVGRKLQKE